MYHSRIAVANCFLALATGCGTIHNLNDPPQGPMFLGTGTCYPFGGATRSGLLAAGGPPCGTMAMIHGSAQVFRGEFRQGFGQFGAGAYLTSAGVIAFADTPLSLCGDVLTLPVVHARCREEPWATWWGEKSFPNWRAPQRTHGGIEELPAIEAEDLTVPCG